MSTAGEHSRLEQDHSEPEDVGTEIFVPRDPRDGWEPGVPSVRAMTPSIIGGALVPLAVYYLVRRQVGGDAPALAVAGIPAAAWVVVQWIRTRRLDPIGAIALVGFIGGLAVSYALGGSAFVLKIREPVLTSIFGVCCFASLWLLPKPVMFYLGRALSAGNDPLREELFDRVWDLPAAPRMFTLITVVWGIGLLCEAATRVFIATVLPTGPFLAVSPVVAASFIAGCFAITIAMNRRFRRQVAILEEGQNAGTAALQG